MKPKDVPIPFRLQKLPKDKRGYPIPFIVHRDADGMPHFQINDHHRRQAAIRQELCAMSGDPLTRGRWFVGGPMSAFSQHGAYVDPPGIWECMEYALKVCPFLVAPNYSKRIDGRTLPADYEEKGGKLMVDEGSVGERPPVFVAVMAIQSAIIWSKPGDPELPPGSIKYIRPAPNAIRDIRVYVQGEEITDREWLKHFVGSTAQELAAMNDPGRTDAWRVIVDKIKKMGG